MTTDTLIILAGTFVAALPFLGFPARFDTILLLLVGILIIGLGVTLRRRSVAGSKKQTETFMATDQERSDHEAI